MSTLRVDAIQNRTGGDLVTAKGMARAWVNFNGTGTVAIRSSFGVSSITDGGTGIYTVNFTTAMPSADYSVSGMARRQSSSVDGPVINIHESTAPTASSIIVKTGTATVGLFDPAYVFVTVHA